MQSQSTIYRGLYIASILLLGVLNVNGQLRISSFNLSTLTFTNAEPGRQYRVEYQVNNQSPWITHTNLQATDTSITVSTPQLDGDLVMVRAVWTDAPPAEPLGVWSYQGFDHEGNVRVSGTIEFDSVAPLTAVMDTVGFIPSSAHLTGEHTLVGEVSGNRIRMSRQSYFFKMSGQMVGNEFYGFWSRYSPGISFPVVSPGKWEGGTFRATRAPAPPAP